MKIKEIIVSAGRTFNHPYESFSNLRPQVTLHAQLLDGEDPHGCAKALQAKAEGLVEDHKQAMLQSIHDIEAMARRDQEIASLEQSIEHNQTRLDNLRKAKDELKQKQLPPTIDDAVEEAFQRDDEALDRADEMAEDYEEEDDIEEDFEDEE